MKEGGFTLLEILVALAVVAISLAGAARMSVMSLATVTALKERTFAHLVAMNQVVRLGVNQDERVPERPASLGGEVMMAGEIFVWRRTEGPGPATEKIEVRSKTGRSVLAAVIFLPNLSAVDREERP